MMRGCRTVLLVVLLVPLAACGIKRPLIAPKDIPAYEAAQKKKLERYKDEDQEAQPELESERAPALPTTPAPAEGVPKQ